MKKVFNKLVRDKFIDIYKHDVDNGISISDYSVKLLNKGDILEHLKAKLSEEVGEVREALSAKDRESLKEEIADVLEVLDGIAFHNNLSMSEIVEIQRLKKEKKGGFETGLYLQSMDYLDK